MSNLAFSLTHRERDALILLASCRAAWAQLDTRSYVSLAEKGLVAFGVAPALTPAGRLAAAFLDELRRCAPAHGRTPEKSLTMAHRSLTKLIHASHSDADGERAGGSASPAPPPQASAGLRS
jgi:hypothetical protein